MGWMDDRYRKGSLLHMILQFTSYMLCLGREGGKVGRKRESFFSMKDWNILVFIG